MSNSSLQKKEGAASISAAQAVNSVGLWVSCVSSSVQSAAAGKVLKLFQNSFLTLLDAVTDWKQISCVHIYVYRRALRCFISTSCTNICIYFSNYCLYWNSFGNESERALLTGSVVEETVPESRQTKSHQPDLSPPVRLRHGKFGLLGLDTVQQLRESVASGPTNPRIVCM